MLFCCGRQLRRRQLRRRHRPLMRINVIQPDNWYWTYFYGTSIYIMCCAYYTHHIQLWAEHAKEAFSSEMLNWMLSICCAVYTTLLHAYPWNRVYMGRWSGLVLLYLSSSIHFKFHCQKVLMGGMDLHLINSPALLKIRGFWDVYPINDVWGIFVFVCFYDAKFNLDWCFYQDLKFFCLMFTFLVWFLIQGFCFSSQLLGVKSDMGLLFFLSASA